MLNLFETVKSHPECFKQLACKVLLVTHYDCPQETALQSLYSEHHFIVYVLKGRRVILRPGYSYEMTEGKCIFSKKGGWMSQKQTEEGWSVLVFFLPDSYLQQFFKEYQAHLFAGHNRGVVNTQMTNLDVNETTKGVFHSMVPYFTQSPPPPETLLELKFRELLFNLLINPENAGFLNQIHIIADRHNQSLSEIMDANFTYNLSLTEFAKLSHLSLASFKREFKKVFQTTPGKWLMQKRLDYARRLISTSSKTVNEIAFESGFESSTHFSRVFRDSFGISPLQYRKQRMSSLVPF